MKQQVDLTNSHYLNEKNRIIPTDPKETWQTMDADYNIQIGNTFGISEQETLAKQGWESA